MKVFLTVCSLASSMAFAGIVTGANATVHPQVYGIHLFFDESEFVDVLKINEVGNGPNNRTPNGEMHVPGDFDGPLLNLAIDDKKISFDLLVPKNLSRPTDSIFHYEGRFFDQTKTQLEGFVTIKTDGLFVASFIGFQRITGTTHDQP